MVQSMRSGTVAQPGETTGCIGCHDKRLAAPVARSGSAPLALRRAPRDLGGWYGPARSFGFATEVQPVLDRHCVECHDYGESAGQTLNLSGDRTLAFNTAYMELWRKGYIKCVGAGPAPVQGAYAWGSHASRLIGEIRQPSIPEHADLELSQEDFDRLVTWVDLNAVYYATYACAYPESRTGRTPLSDMQFKRLSELTGRPLAGMMNYSSNRGIEVNFDRPERSPCLSAITDEGSASYQEALAIIRAGRDMLRRRPRADMVGFVPCAVDRDRQEKYSQRQEAERRSRRAIQRGEKVYD